jgi:hypothetical protein
MIRLLFVMGLLASPALSSAQARIPVVDVEHQDESPFRQQLDDRIGQQVLDELRRQLEMSNSYSLNNRFFPLVADFKVELISFAISAQESALTVVYTARNLQPSFRALHLGTTLLRVRRDDVTAQAKEIFEAFDRLAMSHLGDTAPSRR